jgi:hypothetical protein
MPDARTSTACNRHETTVVDMHTYYAVVELAAVCVDELKDGQENCSRENTMGSCGSAQTDGAHVLKHEGRGLPCLIGVGLCPFGFGVDRLVLLLEKHGAEDFAAGCRHVEANSSADTQTGRKV